MPKAEILMMVDRPLPTDHSFLQGCISKYLSRRAVIHWVGRTSESVGSELPFALHAKGRLGMYLRFLAKSIVLFQYIYKNNVSIIFARNDPVFALFAFFVSRVLNIKFVFQLSHLKEEQVLQKWEGSYLHPFHVRLLARISRALRNYAIRHCDIFLPISNGMLESLEQKGVLSNRALPIGLGYDPDDYSGPIDAPLSFPYIIYVGTLDPIRDFDKVIDGYSLYLEKNPVVGLKLVVIGGHYNDSDRIRYRRLVQKLDLVSNVLFLDQMERKEMISYIRGAKAGLSVIPPLGVNMTISPTKLFEYIGSGIPVIVSSGIPEQDEISSYYHKTYIANTAEEVSVSISNIIQADCSFKNSESQSSDFENQYSYVNVSERLYRELCGGDTF